MYVLAAAQSVSDVHKDVFWLLFLDVMSRVFINFVGVGNFQKMHYETRSVF